MTESAAHLAQLNIGRLAYAKDDPRLSEFMDNLIRVNAIAERTPGFVWRFVDEGGESATEAVVAADDPRVVVNMSVWENVAALERFVWRTIHQRFYQKKADWFEPWPGPHFVLWPVPVGHLPDVEEGMARLAELRDDGPSPRAYGWAGAPDAQLWRRARCA